MTIHHMNEAKITVNRRFLNVGKCDLLKIIIDDKCVADLSNKKGEIEILVNPGIHLVYVRLGYTTTSPLLLNIQEKETIRLHVKSYIYGIKKLFFLLRFIFGDNNIIYLERINIKFK